MAIKQHTGIGERSTLAGFSWAAIWTGSCTAFCFSPWTLLSSWWWHFWAGWSSGAAIDARRKRCFLSLNDSEPPGSVFPAAWSHTPHCTDRHVAPKLLKPQNMDVKQHKNVSTLAKEYKWLLMFVRSAPPAYLSIMHQASVASVHFVVLMWEALRLSDFKVVDWFRQEDILCQDILFFFFFLDSFKFPYLPLGLSGPDADTPVSKSTYVTFFCYAKAVLKIRRSRGMFWIFQDKDRFWFCFV